MESGLIREVVFGYWGGGYKRVSTVATWMNFTFYGLKIVLFSIFTDFCLFSLYITGYRKDSGFFTAAGTCTYNRLEVVLV